MFCCALEFGDVLEDTGEEQRHHPIFFSQRDPAIDTEILQCQFLYLR